MDVMYKTFLEIIIVIIIFLVLVVIGNFVYKRVMISSNMLLSQGEVLPEDEIHTLKQVFYLIIMSLAFADILYSLIPGGAFNFAIFDIFLSLFLAVTLDKSSLKGKVILLLLVPYDSINYLFLFNSPFVSFVGIIHVLIFIYFVKGYYDKFRHYTESNGLGITILILYLIVFFSFIITQLVEGVDPLDALVMVSNAFTSNGYAILGNSITGKLNAIVLVWGGYILSGVGTATLAAAIIIRHFNHRIHEMEESNKELKESIQKLELLIRDNGNSNQTDDKNS